MYENAHWIGLALLLAAALLWRARQRLRLSFAKHPSLRGHARLARRLARWLPYYGYDEKRFFVSDGAPGEVGEQRRAAFRRLAAELQARSPKTIALGRELAEGLSDLRFTGLYRVPFQYREAVRAQLETPGVATASDGVRLRDADGNWYYDLTGAYGVNLFGYDFYKDCIAEAVGLAGDLGPVLGPLHPVVADNVRRLKLISGLDEVSFHMSGTEAVMQAVRLARYHTGRSHLVRFCGAYHGWWGPVQPGIGNPRPEKETYTLRDMDERSLRVLRTRRDIACVLVNPLQAIHPNGNAPGDAALVASDRSAGYDRAAYAAWLRELRAVCSERSIPLIFDEVFLGFRLARGGAQEYFGVPADLVTYGKTLGGGLPVGVVCGRGDLMRRYRENRPTDICFARGTFNAHPYVMAAMNAFLRRIDGPELAASWADLDRRWNARAGRLNERLAEAGVPVRVANMASIFITTYTLPSRYNWMLQYYLSAQGLWLSWVGTGRLIFSHNYSDADFDAVCQRMVAGALAMQADGWCWQNPELSNQRIKRRVLRELLSHGLRG